ncbi:response regulator [Methylobacterium nigriterrae]|uniref:response regulator n=1 Tax=Methylobacterium nigriterrae TaxID=3127512 RepID=UPI00301328F5
MFTAAKHHIHPPLASGQVGILVVEDEPLLLMDTAQSLEDAGLIVFEAHNSQEALEVLAVREDIHVMITDVRMPGGHLNGFQLAKMVAARWPEIGLLVVSGRVRPGPGDLPMNGRFLGKPYLPKALTSNVFAFVSRQSGSI